MAFCMLSPCSKQSLFQFAIACLQQGICFPYSIIHKDACVRFCSATVGF
jgi:hypothetical protein